MSRSFNYDQYLRNLGLSKAERRDLAKPYGNEEAVCESTTTESWRASIVTRLTKSFFDAI